MQIENVYSFLEDFNRRCLAPESTIEQKQKLHKEAKDIYETYFLPGSANFIHFDDEIADELGDSKFSLLLYTIVYLSSGVCYTSGVTYDFTALLFI